MEKLRIDKTSFPMLRQLVAAGELSEDGLRTLMYNDVIVPLAIDRLLENGEGELTEEDRYRIGTELPPGLYRYIRVADDEDKPRVLGTFYMRTVDGVLDELWLARARKGMPPNPVDVVAAGRSFIPSLMGELAQEPRIDRGEVRSTPILPDASGSQGVKGNRPTLGVELIRRSDFDHLWCFPRSKHRPEYRVRSTILAPVLLILREEGCKKVSLSLLRKLVDSHQGAIRRTRKDKGVQ